MSTWAEYLEGNVCPVCEGSGYEYWGPPGAEDEDEYYDCPAHCEMGYLTNPRTLSDVREEDRDIAVGLFRKGYSLAVAWPWFAGMQEARRRTTQRRAGK